MYRTVGNFRVMQNFMVFVNRSASAKIIAVLRILSPSHHLYIYTSVAVSEAIPRNFAPAKIFHYTGNLRVSS